MKALFLVVMGLLSLLPFTSSIQMTYGQNVTFSTGMQTEKKSTSNNTQNNGYEKELRQLRRLLLTKSETSLYAPQIENIGRYFLDKHTGEVTLIVDQWGDILRWRIPREQVSGDRINEENPVNFQLIKYDIQGDDLILVNLITGNMWCLTKDGLTYKSFYFRYIPAVNQ